MVAAVNSPPTSGSEIYNCGSDAENYQLLQVGQAITDEVPGTTLRIHSNSKDLRDYRVSFAGTAERLGYAPVIGLREGIREIRDALISGQHPNFGDADYQIWEWEAQFWNHQISMTIEREAFAHRHFL